MELFDHLMMGFSVAFTPENLQKTYGGRLTLLDQAAEAMRQGEVQS